MKKELITGIACMGAIFAIGLTLTNTNGLEQGNLTLGVTREYSVTIDKNNRLLRDEDGNWMYGYYLHGEGSELGGIGFRANGTAEAHYSVDLESDYAFTWTANNSLGFDIETVDLQQKGYDRYKRYDYYDIKVGGTKRVVRGIPGAKRIELVYDVEHTWRFPVDSRYVGAGWTLTSRTIEGDTVTDIFTKSGEIGEDFAVSRDYQRVEGGQPYDTTNDYPIHFRSITIVYDC